MYKILLVDNYDSFTYNLVHLVQELVGDHIDVVKNDEIPFGHLASYTHLILSPGPGLPDEAGGLKKVIGKHFHKIPMLGVCLGLQAIGEVFGAALTQLPQVYHGARTKIRLTENPSTIFREIPSKFEAGRYHSWVIDPSTVPNNMEVTALDDEGHIMAIQLKHFPIFGVQFHPESFMTEWGKQIVSNFIKWT